ncbi:MAG: hypothetical protein FWH03_03450 [Firmicutes bacterium]|nr:hypothetical protein [Bacillota bacterium]
MKAVPEIYIVAMHESNLQGVGESHLDVQKNFFQDILIKRNNDGACKYYCNRFFNSKKDDLFLFQYRGRIIASAVFLENVKETINESQCYLLKTNSIKVFEPLIEASDIKTIVKDFKGFSRPQKIKDTSIECFQRINTLIANRTMIVKPELHLNGVQKSHDFPIDDESADLNMPRVKTVEQWIKVIENELTLKKSFMPTLVHLLGCENYENSCGKIAKAHNVAVGTINLSLERFAKRVIHITGIDVQIRQVKKKLCWNIPFIGRYVEKRTVFIWTLRPELIKALKTFDLESYEIDSEQPTALVEINLNAEQTFPEMRDFQANETRAFISSGNKTNPYEIMVRREKANKDHEQILKNLATLLSQKDYIIKNNIYIDLLCNANGQDFIFEVKSNNKQNALSQIRKAIAQLYEYRFNYKLFQAKLCIVLQEKPVQKWIIDYLLNDRHILVCWLTDDMVFDCPNECREQLSQLKIIK